MNGTNATPPVDQVTVQCKNRRYTLEFSRLPGQVFGPWDFAETVRDLQVSALLDALSARNLVLTASEAGSAWASVPAR
jgi:hypothetical protein